MGAFKNIYKLVNLGALKFSLLRKLHIFQCMGNIFRVEAQRVFLKFHTTYVTYTLKKMYTILKFNELLDLGAHIYAFLLLPLVFNGTGAFLYARL